MTIDVREARPQSDAPKPRVISRETGSPSAAARPGLVVVSATTTANIVTRRNRHATYGLKAAAPFAQSDEATANTARQKCVDRAARHPTTTARSTAGSHWRSYHQRSTPARASYEASHPWVLYAGATPLIAASPSLHTVTLSALTDPGMGQRERGLRKRSKGGGALLPMGCCGNDDTPPVFCRHDTDGRTAVAGCNQGSTFTRSGDGTVQSHHRPPPSGRLSARRLVNPRASLTTRHPAGRTQPISSPTPGENVNPTPEPGLPEDAMPLLNVTGCTA